MDPLVGCPVGCRPPPAPGLRPRAGPLSSVVRPAGSWILRTPQRGAGHCGLGHGRQKRNGKRGSTVEKLTSQREARLGAQRQGQRRREDPFCAERECVQGTRPPRLAGGPCAHRRGRWSRLGEGRCQRGARRGWETPGRGAQVDIWVTCA